MDLFKKVVSKLFDKEEESILNDCIAFDESGLVFTVFVRNDIPRERLKFVFQEYIRQKQWYLRHTGAASIAAYQTQPDKRTMQIKIGFTGEKERIMQISWSSPNPASVYLFKDLMMEYVDMLASQNMLKLQTKPIPALTNTIELRDFLEEELKPVALMKPEEAMKVLRSSSNELAGLSEEKKALAEHVVFEEDDETGSGLFRAVCELNKECKVVYTTSVLASVANGLDCTSFTISRTNTSATVKVVMRSGMTIDLTMTVGLNESKQRILHGTYPEAHANYGRQFWIRFAEALASQGLLLGQTINRPTVPATTTAAASSSGSSTSPRGASSTTQTAASSASGGSASPRENQQRQNEEDLADDSGLEYDSSDYDNPSSEASVDSDD